MEMAKKIKPVCGIGINDVDYPVSLYAIVCGRKKQVWICPLYRAWKDMLVRCYSEKHHASQPTYIGCSANTEWHSFSKFRAWMLTQDHEGKHLDKDILSPGNKVYGPDTCVFVSQELNTFLTDSAAARGKWPIGVHWSKKTGKLEAGCGNPFTRNGLLKKNDFLGYFDCPNAAHEAWRQRKHEHACRYADMQTDPRIAQALRTRYAQGESHDR